MEVLEIKKRLEIALDILYEKDCYLLLHKVHERSITHKLANYLHLLFPEYDVDCEYDFDIENDSGNFKKKFCELASDEIKGRFNTIVKQKKEFNTEVSILSYIQSIQKNFFPDIIIHKRGSNNDNLLVVEAKKSYNNSGFDIVKLQAYTRNDDTGNKYLLGAQVILSVGEYYSRESTNISYYSVGQKIEL